MGRWLQLLNEHPPDGGPYPGAGHEIVVAELAPHPLLNAARILGDEARTQLPDLYRLHPDNGAYEGDDLWLAPEEARRVLEDFRRFRRIERYEEFLRPLPAEHIQAHWHADPAHADELDSVLARATSEGLWVRVTL